MPAPKPFPCGGQGQPACPPEPTTIVQGFSVDQMQEHGALNYQKGRDDTRAAVLAVLDDPTHGWGDGELARSIRQVIGE